MFKKRYMLFLMLSTVCLFIMSILTAVITIEVLANESDIELIDENGNDVSVINDFVVTEQRLYFSFDKVKTKVNENVAYRVSEDDGSFSELLPIEDDVLYIYPKGERTLKYQFFIYDNDTEKAEAILAKDDFYGVCHRADSKGPKNSFDINEYKRVDGVIYAKGDCPVLDVDEAPLYDTYVEIVSEVGKVIKKIEGHSTINLSEAGEYTISIYEEKNNGARIYSENFPVTVIYDPEAEGSVNFEIERNGGGTYDGKRDDFQIFSNDNIEISVSAEDPISGVEKVELRAGEQVYKNGKIILQNGTLGQLSASYTDNAGNKSDTYVLNDIAMVDRNRPLIELKQDSENENIVVDISLKDSDSGLISSKVMWKDKVIRNENYSESHSYIGERNLRVMLPVSSVKGNEDVLKIETYDYAGNQAKSEYHISVEDNISPSIVISGIRDGAITDKVVALKIAVDDENLDEESVDVTVERQNNGFVEKTKLSVEDKLVFSEDGRYTINASAEDIKGNRSSDSIAFTIDTAAPEIEGLKKYKDSRLTEFSLKNDMKNMFQDDSVVSYHIYLNGRDYNGDEIISDPGEYVVQVLAVDQNGNIAEDQAEFVIYDNGEPNYLDDKLDEAMETEEDLEKLNDASVSDNSNSVEITATKKETQLKLGQNIQSDKDVITASKVDESNKIHKDGSDKKQNLIIFILALILLGIGAISVLIFVTR